jgi:mRNA interferase MazF
MVIPAAGNIIIVPFPFTDLSANKIRPAVVLASAGRKDWVLCQITSNPYNDSRAVMLDAAAYASGALHVTSYARPGKLFTLNEDVMIGKEATLKRDKFNQVLQAVIKLLRSEAMAA